jgi:hypothetical protein
VAGESGSRFRQRCPSVRRQSASNVGVRAVGLVAGQSIALPQGLDRPAGHDHHTEVGLEQRVDHRPVGTLDGHAVDTVFAQAPTELVEPFGTVLDVELVDQVPVAVDDRHGMRVGRPVDTAKVDGGILHVSLLAAYSVGKHPVVQGRVSRSLTDRRSGALSPIASRHVLGRRPPLH